MKSQAKLIQINKKNVRMSIMLRGIWNGIVKYHDSYQDRDKLVYATLSNIASLQDVNLLEFYILAE